MKKIYGIFAVLALFGALLASGAEEIAAGKALVDAKAECSKLSDDQLESIGEYIMELRHPGEAHEYMDRMMGGEGSASLKNAHIQMAKVLYCGDASVPVTYGGMMGMGMMGGGMMGGYATGASGYGGMMNGFGGMMGRGSFGNPSGYGMMGNYGYGFASGWSLFDILLVVLLIGLILVVYAHAWQKFSEGKKKK
ncbi:MAG: hypothetical protein QW568_04900 [Candidatus Anstonellaceae archaeon]